MYFVVVVVVVVCLFYLFDVQIVKFSRMYSTHELKVSRYVVLSSNCQANCQCSYHDDPVPVTHTLAYYYGLGLVFSCVEYFFVCLFVCCFSRWH